MYEDATSVIRVIWFIWISTRSIPNIFKEVFTLDFGFSFIVFPRPAREIVLRYLPWSVGLLLFTTIISWTLGNILGVIVSFVKNRYISGALENIAIVLYPIPYYVFSLALIYVFAYLIPIFSLSPATMPAINIASLWDLINMVFHMLKTVSAPALSIIVISAFGWWFISSRTLSLATMTEDYVVYARLRGIDIGRIRGRYVLRGIMVPQVTALALALGAIFSGALVTEYIFAYPGLGSLLYQAIIIGDYPIALTILSLSMIGVTLATWFLDTVVYYLVDPRIRFAR
uniref:ABC transporter permease n=1 Tax=Ignisphaera aggregans TaxID=334771 RepID=A0A7C5YZ78_9CREN